MGMGLMNLKKNDYGFSRRGAAVKTWNGNSKKKQIHLMRFEDFY